MKCECMYEKEKFDITSLIDEDIKKQDIELTKVIEREKADIRKAAIFTKPFIKRKSDLSALKDSIQSIPKCDTSSIALKYAKVTSSPFARIEKP